MSKEMTTSNCCNTKMHEFDLELPNEFTGDAELHHVYVCIACEKYCQPARKRIYNNPKYVVEFEERS